MERKPKFDLVITNPPYNKNLHLKILERVIPMSCETVNISPTGWLMDIPAVIGWKNTTFQRFEDGVAKHIREYKHLDANDANELFGIGSFESVSMTSLTNDTYSLYKTLYLNDKRKLMSVFDKTIVKVHSGDIGNIAEHVKLSTIHGHPGMKDEFDIMTPQKDIAYKFKPEHMSEEEWDIFHESCGTIFMKYMNMLTRQGQHIQTKLLPWMGDYSEPWSDKRYCEAFGITDEEWAHIESVMGKYM